MADYKPPTEQLPIFDSSVFLSGDQTLTQNQADKRYLRYPNAQGTENLQAINVNGPADFNTSVNIDGILTTTNAINMTGGSTGLNNIATRQLSLKDATNGNNNGSSILTNGNVLTVDSVGPNATNTITQFTLRNTANTVITPLQLTTTVNNMNVPLDMTGGSQSLSVVRSRVYGFRDINTGTLANSAIYYQSNGMVIECTTANSNFSILTQNGVGGNTTMFSGNSIEIYTNTPTISSTSDASNKIPTTQWVQNVLTSYVPTTPASSLRRAWSSGNFTGGGGNAAYDIFISNSGTASTVWTQNETLTLRVSLHQQWSNRGTSPTDSTLYQTVSADVVLYPYRFTNGWLNDSGGPQGAPRGEINQNGIYATAGLTSAFAPQDATYFPNGRQFWCNQLNWAYNTGGSAPTGRLYICGITGNVNGVRFIVSNPYGFNTVPSGSVGTYSFNFSVELLNAGDTGATISTSNFTVNF